MPPTPPSGIPSSIRLSTQMPAGSKVPAGTQPNQLDNPPLTRSIIPGAVPPQYVLSDPFAGFGMLEILNIRVAMNAHLEKETNPDNVEAVKRVLAVLSAKLDPRPLNAGLAILPVPTPPAALVGTVSLPQPLPLK